MYAGTAYIALFLLELGDNTLGLGALSQRVGRRLFDFATERLRGRCPARLLLPVGIRVLSVSSPPRRAGCVLACSAAYCDMRVSRALRHAARHVHVPVLHLHAWALTRVAADMSITGILDSKSVHTNLRHGGAAASWVRYAVQESSWCVSACTRGNLQ